MEGLDDKDFEKGLKYFLKRIKKKFSCNGSIDKNTNTIQVQGDQREKIKDYLVNRYNLNSEDIIVHGV